MKTIINLCLNVLSMVTFCLESLSVLSVTQNKARLSVLNKGQ